MGVKCRETAHSHGGIGACRQGVQNDALFAMGRRGLLQMAQQPFSEPAEHHEAVEDVLSTAHRRPTPPCPPRLACGKSKQA